MDTVHWTVASPYSDDFRQKFLEAHQEGLGTLEELAERFRVSVAWAKKVSATCGKTGKMERPPGRKRGRASKVTAEVEAFLRSVVAAQPDSTLGELQWRLLQERELEISIGTLWHTLERLNLRLKKNGSR